jgi:ABC-2 type transport system permease protein
MKSILFNEWKNLLSTPGMQIAAFVLMAALGFTAWAGLEEYRVVAQMEGEAKTHLRQQWESMGPSNPHSAAHFGTYVFKKNHALTAFDEGANSYVGRTLYLEGHRQNELVQSDAAQGDVLSRFGKLRPALILQIILPLLLLLFAFQSVRSERDADRLRLLLVQGVSYSKLLYGKLWSLWIPGMGFVLLTLGIQMGLLGFSGPLVGRALLLAVGYGLFYWIVIALALWLSSKTVKSYTALSWLLGIWIVWVIFYPKVTYSVAGILYPLPDRVEFSASMKEDRSALLDGHNPEEEALKVLEDSVLNAYGVTSKEELPINFDGLLMQADEEFGNRVWDKHFGELYDQMQKQKSLVQWASLPNPFGNLQSLSMGAAGTDNFHQVDFLREAEDYRRVFIRTLNERHAYGGSKTGDWGYKEDQEFFNSIADFQYAEPSFPDLIRQQTPSLILLLVWIGLLAIGIFRVQPKLSAL